MKRTRSILARALALGLASVTSPVVAEEVAFDVLEYVVEGNSVLPSSLIEESVYPHLGEHKGLTAVEQARADLEQAYHRSGYLTVFVDIPEQKVDGGVVRLRVTEGKVDRLRVTGSRYFALGEIKAANPDLAEGGVPYFPEVQRQLAAVNRGADRRVTPVMRPGRTPGTVEVDLKVEDKLPLHGDLELNDRYSANTSHTRLSGNLRYDNLGQSGHGLSLGFQVAPENVDDALILTATYILPTASGRTYAFYAVRSRSDVAQSGDLRVLGDTDILGARLIQPLPVRGEGYQHSLSLGLDYKNSRESQVFGSDTSTTPIDYLPWSIAYNLTRMAPGGQTQMNLTLGFALRGLGDDMVDCPGRGVINEFECKRGGDAITGEGRARANYALLKASLRDTRQFGNDWRLSARVEGQFAPAPLIANEQFSVGGVESVRGYLESAASGDRGIQGSVELSGPEWAGRLGGAVASLRGAVFVDGARVWVVEPVAGQTESFTLASVGLGLRLGGAGLTSSLDLAWPLRTLTTASFDIRQGDPRLHWRLGYQF